MKGVSRGAYVAFTGAQTDKGRPAPDGRGVVLDRAFAPTCWYVMPEDGDGRAVIVKASAMESCSRMHGASR